MVFLCSNDSFWMEESNPKVFAIFPDLIDLNCVYIIY
uniref:Uncharacterized protein n=1 Tax=Rhizophora mucronata TaxID=61149 RepID=A0A2P2Q1V9_RHIMU